MDKTIMIEREYFHPTPRDIDWGLYLLGVGVNRGDTTTISKDGRVLKDFALVYITEGLGDFYINKNQHIEVKPGDLFMIFPNAWHRYRSRKEVGWEENWILFNGSYPQALLEKGFFNIQDPVISLGMDNQVFSSFAQLKSIGIKKQFGYQREASALIMKILTRIQNLNQAKEQRQLAPIIEQAVIYIEKHWREDIDIDLLAKKLYISTPHFRRIFKKALGLPPHQYHLSIKINRAKELLDCNRSVKEVATMLNLTDQYYFSRIFKKKTGIPPSEWRQI